MKHFFFGFSLCFILFGGILIKLLWPAELNLLFDGLFYITLLQLLLSIFLIALLYKGKVGITRGSKFSFGIMLIVTAALMYSNFGLIDTNAHEWQPYISKRYGDLVLILQIFVSHARTIISFGIAAIGASYAANVIYDHKPN